MAIRIVWNNDTVSVVEAETLQDALDALDMTVDDRDGLWSWSIIEEE